MPKCDGACLCVSAVPPRKMAFGSPRELGVPQCVMCQGRDVCCKKNLPDFITANEDATHPPFRLSINMMRGGFRVSRATDSATERAMRASSTSGIMLKAL